MKRRAIICRWMICCFALTVIMALGAAAAFIIYIINLLPIDQALSPIICAVLASIIFIGISAAAGVYFVNSITKPLNILSRITEKISSGSYGIRCEKLRNDEIGDLFDSINAMSADIAKSESLQTEFISSVSHELRTPLTAITGWSETLAYDEKIKGDSRRGIDIISKEAGRLTKMVEELLDFTRIQTGRFKLSMERMDLAAELEDTVFAYDGLIRQSGVEIRYIPKEDGPVYVNGDPEKLRQVFLNLLDNAAKHGRSGKNAEVSLIKDSENVIVSVRDFGRGIPEDELPHVKERFYKGSSKERGSGIGLAVCDEIISRHGGTLEIKNAEGGGAVATVSIPAVK